MPLAPPGRRAVVVAGCRTPFAKAGTVFRDATAAELARHCTRELLYRTELSGDEVDEVIYGQVVPSPLVPNVAREVSLLPQFPARLPPIPSTAPVPRGRRPWPTPPTRSMPVTRMP